MKVKIARSAYTLILLETERNPGLEVCGLLLGGEGEIEQAVPARNVAADPRRRFEIDPAELLACHRRARAGGKTVLGHYHSHPEGRPSPSLRDAANTHQDGAIWIIAGSSGALAAFQAIRDGEIAGRFAPVELEIV